MTPAVSSGGVTDYSVEISLTRTEELKAGMNVTVEILVAQSEDCMSVPSEAVTGGVVRVLRDGAREPVEVPVETGLSGDGVTEIRSGPVAGGLGSSWMLIKMGVSIGWENEIKTVLLKSVQLYDPDPKGICDLFLCGGRVAAVAGG